MLMTYWKIGERIVIEEQNGNARAEYGKQLISRLAKDLTNIYGEGYSARSLREYRQFYLTFPEKDFWRTCAPNLTWSHFRRIMQVVEQKARQWYLKEAAEQAWSVRTDVGQMDMYVRMYDDLKRGENDNPTMGIILCSETDETVARYSVLHDSEQLFATKYKLCLPDEKELRREIELQKEIFRLQHSNDENDE